MKFVCVFLTSYQTENALTFSIIVNEFDILFLTNSIMTITYQVCKEKLHLEFIRERINWSSTSEWEVVNDCFYYSRSCNKNTREKKKIVQSSKEKWISN